MKFPPSLSPPPPHFITCFGYVSPVPELTSHLDQSRTGNIHCNSPLAEKKKKKSHSFVYFTQRNIIAFIQNGWNWSINSETIKGRLGDWQTKGKGTRGYEFFAYWGTRLKIAIDCESTKLWDALKSFVCSITEVKVGGEIILKKKFIREKSVLAIIYLFPGLRKNIIAFQLNCKEQEGETLPALITDHVLPGRTTVSPYRVIHIRG